MPMVAATMVICVLSFSVWLHHFFTMGAGADVNAIFGILSTIIAVPTGGKVFNWMFTMYRGRILFATDVGMVRIPKQSNVGGIGLFQNLAQCGRVGKVPVRFDYDHDVLWTGIIAKLAQRLCDVPESLISPTAMPRMTSVDDCDPELPPAEMSSGT